MATITTPVPSSSHHIRTAALAAIALLITVGAATTVWAVADTGPGTEGNVATTPLKSSDQLRAEFDTYLRDQRAATTYSTSVKSPDQVQVEFEAWLRDQSASGDVTPSVKSSDQVRAEFDTYLRHQRAASMTPVSVKSADQVQVEFETWLREQLRPAGN